jgi:hypothetical protein
VPHCLPEEEGMKGRRLLSLPKMIPYQRKYLIFVQSV